MQISFNLPHVFNQGSSPRDNAYALRTLLDCLIDLNVAHLRFHKTKSLLKSGVTYKRVEIWDTIPALYLRGYGDCKALTAALVAEYRVNGVDASPVFRSGKKPDGSTAYHILVMLKDPAQAGPWPYEINKGKCFVDPSVYFGMEKFNDGF